MNKQEIEGNLIVSLTFDFSISIVKYCEELDSIRKFPLSNQLFRSGTGIGANVWEAQNAESKADFVHKFKLAAKEMEESKYWLLLCDQFEFWPDPKNILNKLDEIQRIITKIIATTKKSSR